MFIEHETFPAQFLGELDLLQNLLVVDIVGRIDVRVVGREDVDIEVHVVLLLIVNAVTQSARSGKAETKRSSNFTAEGTETTE